MRWVLVLNHTGTPFFTADFPFSVNRPQYTRTVNYYSDGTIELPAFTDVLDVPKIEVVFPIRPDVAIMLVDPRCPSGPSIIEATPHDVRNIKQSQTVAAQRFLFAPDNDFTLLMEAMNEHPELFAPNARRINLVEE